MRIKALSALHRTTLHMCHPVGAKVTTGRISERRHERRANGLRARVVSSRLVTQNLALSNQTRCPTAPVRSLNKRPRGTQSRLQRSRSPMRTRQPEKLLDDWSFQGFVSSSLEAQALCKSLCINWTSQTLLATKSKSTESPRWLHLGTASAHAHDLRSPPSAARAGKFTNTPLSLPLPKNRGHDLAQRLRTPRGPLLKCCASRSSACRRQSAP